MPTRPEAERPGNPAAGSASGGPAPVPGQVPVPVPARVSLEFAPSLRLFLRPRDRGGLVTVEHDGTSSLGHVIESCGVPLPEIGPVTVEHSRDVHGRQAQREERIGASYRPMDGDVVHVAAVERPQRLPGPAGFLLDVHLGTLARRLRLVGVDAAYQNDLDDDVLIERANDERRVLLTQDRGLLRRRLLWCGAYVRGADPDDQFSDVLDRFDPPLFPWTRCTACNGHVSPAGKDDVRPLLQPGTRRTYEIFARCDDCGKVYWRGAHHRRLEEIVAAARRRQTGMPDSL